MKDERAKMKIASKREQRELVHYAEREQLKACIAGISRMASKLKIEKEKINYVKENYYLC